MSADLASDLLATRRVPDRPDLAVIDRAIEILRRGRHYAAFYSCHALMFAESESLAGVSEYARQYEMWTKKSKGRLPIWWGTRSGLHIGSRIAALKSFRQACIDAAIQAPGAGHGAAE